MVRLLAPALLLAAGFAAADAARPATLSYWIVQATSEGREEAEFDAGAAELRDALSGLPHDTFRLISAGRARVGAGETRLPLTDKHTALLKLTERDERARRCRVEVAVEIAPKDPEEEPVIAMRVRLSLAPGKPVQLGGMRLDEGDLILVLRLEE